MPLHVNDGLALGAKAMKLWKSIRFIHRAVKTLEPWGILLAVAGLSFSLWTFQIEKAAREEDRINRAIGQFADGIGRIDALRILLRNDVDLRSFKADDAYLPQANLSGEILFRAHLSQADLSGADLSGAKLSRADLSGADLPGADLSGADLPGADLSGADLPGANLSGADLSGADLSGAKLSSVKLFLVDLSGAKLSTTHLLRRNLSQAQLSRAKLSGADLSGANLSGADLSGADISRGGFFAAGWICTTTAPDETTCNRDCLGHDTSCSWLDQAHETTSPSP